MKGRPKKTLPNGEDKYDIPTMCKKIDEYILSTKKGLPILKECCLENGWCYDRIMQLQREHNALLQSIKKLHAQREINLEKGLAGGKMNSAGAIFLLKQPVHGYKDKWETEESKEDKIDTKIEFTFVDARKKEEE